MSKASTCCVAEGVGTFALTFIGAGAILTTSFTGGEPGLVGIAFAHGLVLAIVVSATMNISGGRISSPVWSRMCTFASERNSSSWLSNSLVIASQSVFSAMASNGCDDKLRRIRASFLAFPIALLASWIRSLIF